MQSGDSVTRKFTVLIEKDEDGILVAKVPDIPGCHTQAKSMPKLLERIKEAIELCLEEKKSHNEHLPHSEFIGVVVIPASS